MGGCSGGLERSQYRVWDLGRPLAVIGYVASGKSFPSVSLNLLIPKIGVRALPAQSYRGHEMGNILFNAKAQRAHYLSVNPSLATGWQFLYL